MKAKKLISLFCVVACVFSMMMLPVSARASDQIDDYLVEVKSEDGQIYINFSVSGTGTMYFLGCERFFIFYRICGRFG